MANDAHVAGDVVDAGPLVLVVVDPLPVGAGIYAQIAPLQYLRPIRLAVAQMALASGGSVTEAAAGFSSDTQLRRAWQLFAVPAPLARAAGPGFTD